MSLRVPMIHSNSRCRRRFLPRLLALLAMLVVLACGNAETVLEKQLPSRAKIKVIFKTEEATAEERSPTFWEPTRASCLIATWYSDKWPNGLMVWSNRWFVYERYRYLNTHTPYDACQVGSNVFLCYKEAVALCVERIYPVETNRPRERYWLMRDSPELPLPLGQIWTNATFKGSTNGSLLLVAYNDRGETAVWEYKNQSWELDLVRTTPEPVRERAYVEWALLAFESNRWVVKRQYPRPMPRAQSR